MLAISERVVIRADDLLNWCDDTINWTYGLRANTLLKASKSDLGDKADAGSDGAPQKPESDSSGLDLMVNSNIRALKNSKLDFAEVEKEKGKAVYSIGESFYYDENAFESKNDKWQMIV